MKNLKKFISIVIVITMLVSTFSLPASAYNWDDGGIQTVETSEKVATNQTTNAAIIVDDVAYSVNVGEVYSYYYYPISTSKKSIFRKF